MKKILAALLVLTVMASIPACGTRAQPSPEPSVSQPPAPGDGEDTEAGAAAALEKETRQAFGRVLWDAYQLGVLPDGSVLDGAGTERGAENCFAVADIDGDGQEELLLYWVDACMAGMVGYVFGYRDGVSRQEFAAFPDFTIYDNGFIKANWSHNHGPGGDFWPYSVYRYHAQTDTFRSWGGAEAWDRTYC